MEEKNNQILSKSYESVWNNCYIKSLINHHLKLFIIFEKREFNSLKEYLEFQYKEYLIIVSFNFHIDNSIDLNALLPSNIEVLKLNEQEYTNCKLNVPYTIKKLVTFNIDKFSKQSLVNSNICKLSVGENKIYFKDILPKSITNLNLLDYGFKLNKDLPNTIKKLKCNNFYNNRKGSIPSSVTNLTLEINYPVLTRFSLPNNLISLTFNYFSSSNLKFGKGFKFPHTLLYLNICVDEIKFKFPPNLEVLIFSITSNKPIKSGVLPNTLKRFEFTGFGNFDHDDIIFPNSIESLLFRRNIHKYSINRNLTRDILPVNLKSLSFDNYHTIRVLSNGFNNGGYPLIEKGLFDHTSLTSINFGDVFNIKIGANVFSNLKSLTSIEFGNQYNQDFDINVLPINLKKLYLGYSFCYEFKNGVLPDKLEYISILNSKYQYEINPPNPNTRVNVDKYIFQFNTKPDQLKSCYINGGLRETLKDYPLKDKINLQELYILNTGLIDINDLPQNNTIKLLSLSYGVKGEINLEDFKYLETLIIESYDIKLTTSQIYNNNQIEYNLYNLKSIVIDKNNDSFINSLNQIFFQFIKFKK